MQSRLGRALLIALGTLCVALAFLGAVLPLLPTTPFLLAAAACFVRSSARLHRKLYENRLFGEYLRRFQAGEGMPRRAKITTLALLWLSLGLSAWLGVPDRLWWVRLLLAGIGLGVSIHILRFKTRID